MGLIQLPAQCPARLGTRQLLGEGMTGPAGSWQGGEKGPRHLIIYPLFISFKAHPQCRLFQEACLDHFLPPCPIVL